jgi:hypothetical protein
VVFDAGTRNVIAENCTDVIDGGGWRVDNSVA